MPKKSLLTWKTGVKTVNLVAEDTQLVRLKIEFFSTKSKPANITLLAANFFVLRRFLYARRG